MKMQRIISLILTVCIMSSLLVFDVNAEVKGINDGSWYEWGRIDFEDSALDVGESLWYEDGWTPQANPNPATMPATFERNPDITSLVNASNHVMMISRTARNDSANERIYKSFEFDGNIVEATGDVKVSFDLFAKAGESEKQFQVMLRSSSASANEDGAPGNRFAIINFENGNIKVNDTDVNAFDKGSADSPAYPIAGEWFTCTICANTSNKELDIYIDGTKLNVDPISLPNTSAADISRVCFNIDRYISTQTTWYVDNMILSQTTEPVASPVPPPMRPLNAEWYLWHEDTFDNLNTLSEGDSLWTVDDWQSQTAPASPTMPATIEKDPKGEETEFDYANKVLKLERTSTSDSNERLYKLIKVNDNTLEASGYVRFSMKIMAGKGNSDGPFEFSLRNSSTNGENGGGAPGDRLVYLYFKNGDITCQGGAGNVVISGAYPKQNKWFTLDIVMDTEAKNYDVCIDGKRINAESIPFKTTDTENTKISRVCFDIPRGTTTQEVRYFDDLRFYLTTPKPVQETGFAPNMHIYANMDFENAGAKNIDKSVDGWSDWKLTNVLDIPTLTSTVIVDPSDQSNGGWSDKNKLLKLYRISRNPNLNESPMFLVKENFSVQRLTGKINVSLRVNPVKYDGGSFMLALRNSNSNSVQLGDYMCLLRFETNGSIKYSTSGGTTEIATKTFQKTGWSTIELHVDTETRGTDLYLNNVKINSEPIPYYFGELSETLNHISIVETNFDRYSSHQSIAYIDDIVVWKDCTDIFTDDLKNNIGWENISNGQEQNNVTASLDLPVSVGTDFAVKWESSDENILSNTGVITRKNYTQEVDLTGRIIYEPNKSYSRNAYYEEKYHITIPANADVDAQSTADSIAEDYLSAELISNEELSAVTSNLNLITSAPNGATVEWSSTLSDGITSTDVIDVNTSAVTRGDEDVDVILTAKVTIPTPDGGTVEATKVFNVKVLRNKTASEEIDEAYNSLNWVDISFEAQEEPITKDLILPIKNDNGVKIRWNDPSGIVSSKGKLTRPSQNTEVTLTASFEKGGITKTNSFTFTVKMSRESMAHADFDAIEIANKNELVSDFKLPVIGSVYGLPISWKSDNEAITIKSKSNAVVTRPEYVDGDKNVILTASFLVEGDLIDMNIPVTVKKLPSDEELVQNAYNYINNWANISIDEQNAVFRNLHLIKEYDGGVVCEWSIANADGGSDDVVLESGEVINPPAGSENREVTLTVDISKRDAHLTKSYDIVVLAFDSDEDALEKAFNNLTFDSIHSEKINEVKSDISLPVDWKYGSTITWSGDTGLIDISNTADGLKAVVQRNTYGGGDVFAKLKATISLNGTTKEKVFTITIKEEDSDKTYINQSFDNAPVGTKEFVDINDPSSKGYPADTGLKMYIDNAADGSNNKVLTLKHPADFTPSGEDKFNYKSNGSAMGIAVFSGRFYMKEGCEKWFFLECLSGTSSQIQIYFMPNGQIRFTVPEDDSSKATLITKDVTDAADGGYYNQGEWVSFRVEANTVSKRFKCYVRTERGEKCVTENGRLSYEGAGDFDSSEDLKMVNYFDDTQDFSIKGYRISLQSKQFASEALVNVDDFVLSAQTVHNTELIEAAESFEREFLGTIDLGSVTGDIVFPTPIGNETISVKSSNVKVISNMGKIVPVDNDTEVSLVVSFTLNDAVLKKVYNVTVKGAGSIVLTDDEAARKDLEYVINQIKSSCDLNNVTDNLPFGTAKYGSAITYSSNDTGVVSNTGAVSRPRGSDAAAIITVTSAKGSASYTEQINVIVKKRPETYTSGGGGGGSQVVISIPNKEIMKPDVSITPTLPFDDVDVNHWAYNDILAVYEKGIMNGRADDVFATEDNVLREEFVAIICRAFNIKNLTKDAEFTDVNDGAWYRDDVVSAANLNIVLGDSTGAFGVGQYITKQDMVTILYRTLKIKQIELSADGNGKISDSDAVADYAKEAVDLLVQAGVISGDENRNFNPTSHATRAQIAKIINSVLKKIENNN